jgi:hypothetical protein
LGINYCKTSEFGIAEAILGEKYSYKKIDFSDLEMIQAPAEINCLKKKYRVIGGVFYGTKVTTIYERPEEFVNDVVEWSHIPQKSAFEKLSRIICQEGKGDTE